MKRFAIRMMVFVAGLAGIVATTSRMSADEKTADPAALKRAREHAEMLDTLYKTAVVGITKTYVNQQADVPAATVAAALFETMKKNKYHDARLIDASGKPKNDENVAKTEFEKKVVKAMKDGKAKIEEVGEKDGKPVLRVGTVVPAVLKQCATCHRVKEGDLLGAIVYEIPIK